MRPAVEFLESKPTFLEKISAGLPVATRRAGETVLNAGLKTDLLLILKNGAVAILKDSVEIARVDQPGAVLGELSALLDQPHSAEVRALEDTQFYVADAELLEKDPTVLLYVARIIAARLVAADSSLAEAKKQSRTGQPPSLGDMLDKLQRILVGPKPSRLTSLRGR
jgi:CRP-like cAMP-binding protein